ncbi:MAG: LysM peptidoglycan-binding domain-containing protein [Oscillospiraceae bacterium]|jgi:hypothetical protein|nr:LysM peptidoglycan-binding domain-containing protein [Oscillospiraceae bacterium]
MSYAFYLGEVLLPVAPARLEISRGNKLKKFDLLSGEEIAVLGGRALSEIKFSALLPQTRYPFAVYTDGFKKGSAIFDEIIKLKESEKPFRFIVLRKNANGKKLFSTNIKALFSEIRAREDAGEGFDIFADITLTEYRDFSVKKISAPTRDVRFGRTVRPTDSAPAAKTHTVVKGDCLWMIAQRFLGDGARYKEIYNLNKSIIDAGNKGTGNPVHTIYAGQVFNLPD